MRWQKVLYQKGFYYCLKLKVRRTTATTGELKRTKPSLAIETLLILREYFLIFPIAGLISQKQNLPYRPCSDNKTVKVNMTVHMFLFLVPRL